MLHEFVILSTQPVRIRGQKLKRECEDFETRQDEAAKFFVRTSKVGAYCGIATNGVFGAMKLGRNTDVDKSSHRGGVSMLQPK